MGQKVKKALCLAGGGPAAGLHIGALDAFAEAGFEFDVWSLSCIGAWVGVVYNSLPGGRLLDTGRVEKTFEFFRDKIFRNDDSYARFPVNSVFGPDFMTTGRAMLEFMANPASYDKLVQPGEIAAAVGRTLSCMWTDPMRFWREGDANNWWLNDVLAVNPLSRFLVSLVYLSNYNGLSRIYYPESRFLERINFAALKLAEKPLIYHNAFNLERQKLALFTNRPVTTSTCEPKAGETSKHLWGHDGPKKERLKYARIRPETLCACSALPYIEQTVKVDGEVHCEGALVDTVNFVNLVEDHPDLDEIWVIRIVDTKQIRVPKNLTNSLENLCQLFAAEVGENDVKLFRRHLQDRAKAGKKIPEVIEVAPSENINFDWSHSNLKIGRLLGKLAAKQALASRAAPPPRKLKRRSTSPRDAAHPPSGGIPTSTGRATSGNGQGRRPGRPH